MSSPFPGMDPYLEAPEIWRGFHRAAYARRIDYTLPVPPPPLRPAMQRWLAVHLAPSPKPTDS